MKKILSASDNSDKLFIESLKKLPSGIYFILVSDGTNKFARKIIHM